MAQTSTFAFPLKVFWSFYWKEGYSVVTDWSGLTCLVNDGILFMNESVSLRISSTVWKWWLNHAIRKTIPAHGFPSWHNRLLTHQFVWTCVGMWNIAIFLPTYYANFSSPGVVVWKFFNGMNYIVDIYGQRISIRIFNIYWHILKRASSYSEHLLTIFIFHFLCVLSR